MNAFERAQPAEFTNEVVALVDLGFKSSVISILMQGELAMTRVVSIGGDKLTAGVAESLVVSYAEAEGIKVGLPEEVQSVMQALLMPLGRELRASIDFFEHQNDRQVSQVFLSGAASRSDFILQTLQAELMVPCKNWNCVGPYQLALPPQQLAELEQVSPQLTVAVGAAMAVF
jgi:Tfp pilus assembly PilM family ATPase